MPWPVYSERFLYTAQENVWVGYTVPLGMRAVVKSVQAANLTSTQREILVYLQDRPVVEHLLQARSSFQSPPLALVAYGGELLKCVSDSTGMAIWVCGYLLDDTSGRTGPPGGNVLDEDPPPGWVAGTGDAQ